MLEPLEICNLACHGCGRIREYEHVFHKRMEVEECLRVAEEAGAPIVNIPGGEPMIHKQIDEIVNGITAQGRFVYMCTNGLLMNRAFGRIPPSNHFAFVVHLDGMREVHDKAVDRDGRVRQGHGLHARGDRSSAIACAPTPPSTAASPAEAYVELFRFLKDMGVEGCITAPGFDYESVTHDREQFLAAHRGAGPVHRGARALRPHGHPLLQQPPLPRVPAGEAQLPVHGLGDAHLHRRGLAQPCYLLADKHVGSLRSCTTRPTGRPTAPTATRGARTA